MFKSSRWRSEKNKIKSVFKLQFHATQVSQLGVDALIVSVIPGDIGKPTVKLDKAIVRDGSCRWENPILETIKFFREPRTGKISAKIYRFSVSTGSAKNGVLGEISIDFANYAEANKASTVSLPIKNSNSGALLHVFIQRLQANVDQRDVEECDDAKSKSQDMSLKTHLSNGDIDETIMIDEPINKTIHNAELNGNDRASSGSDITLSSSDSSSGVNTPRELGMRNVEVHPEPPPLRTGAFASTNYEEHQRSQWEWSGGSDHGVHTDDSTQSSHGERSHQPLDVEIEKLKSELIALARQADVSELELQTLRKQIVKESKRGHDLSKEVSSLKEERDSLKEECERHRSFHKRSDNAQINNKLQSGDDLRAALEEIRQELNYEKDLNANLRLQLQKTQESNAELIFAVRDLEELLEQKNNKTTDRSNKSGSFEDDAELKANMGKCETDDEEQNALEEIVKEHRQKNETSLLEQKIIDLYSEIEIYRRDKDELEMQMEQLALDYEILKQENHDMSYKLEQSQLQEQLKMQYECSYHLNDFESQNESLENELKTRSEEFSDSLVRIKELESDSKSLEEELKARSKEFSDSVVTIKELESHSKCLEEELKTRSKDFSDSLVRIKELESHIGNLEEELKKQSKEFSDSLVTIKELKSDIRSLEEELKTQSEEFSDSSVNIKELESHIKSLEEELEEQAQGFEADLEVLMVAKVEQEQRAIRAEEALRKIKWKNAATAEKLQEEFRRLTKQMASTFDANEKVALKAMTEAGELRVQKSQLEEMLRKTKDELQAVRDEHEAKLHELSNQIYDKTSQMEKMSLEVDDTTKQLEHQKKHEEEIKETFSREVSQLKAEIRRLETEISCISEHAGHSKSLIDELEKVKASAKNNEMLLERGNVERNELLNRIALVQKEADQSLEELNRMKNLKDEKEATVELLQSELEKLKAQCGTFKNSLFEDEVEKEKLRKQVFQLKNDLKKKEDALISMEKKLKDSNGRVAISNGTKTTQKNNKSATVPRNLNEVTGLKEKIKLLEGQIKSKEAALEISATSFMEKEKDLQNKMGELGSQVEELIQSSAFQKVLKDASTLTSNSVVLEESSKEDEKEKNNLDDLVTELGLLKENNRLMECELKEMQERYSEISLKFAEVEGERQKLVMTVRNLKNAKKAYN
ncbi:hypothetical protein UlMin_001907 [Ulmus minor]